MVEKTMTERRQDTVVVVDDDHLICQAIEGLLESVGLTSKTYSSPVQLLDEFDADGTACLITDVRLPLISGPDLYRRLRERQPELSVVFLTGYADVETATACMRLGALDFIEKPFHPQRLLDQVQKALYEHEASRRRARFRAEFDERTSRLTDRERTVAELVVEGLRNREIAERLGIALKTAEGHRANMMTKMETTSTAQLVRYLLEAACAFPERATQSIPWATGVPSRGGTTSWHQGCGACSEVGASCEAVGVA